MKITTITEVIDQYMRESAVNPDVEARIINMGEITSIFSVGTDGNLYLTKENEDGKASRFDRYKLIDGVTSFAAEKINEQTIAVGIISNGNVYISYTENPEELKLDKMNRMDFSGALGSIHLTPYRVLMTSSDNAITMFVEFHEDSGFTHQFAAVLDCSDHTSAEYYRLPSEFTDVTGIAAGRATRQLVDGTYTFGVFHAGNEYPYKGYETDVPQLIYTPSYNPFGSTLPSPIRLKTDINLEAICTLKSTIADKLETHLFAVGKGKLLFYHYNDQYDWIQSEGKGVPKLIIESSSILNAKQIAAYTLSDRVYVFIRTTGGDLNYTVADYHNDTPDKFMEPVNLMKDVLSFDINDGRMTIFTKNEFIECTHDPITGAFKMDKVSVSTELDTNICFSAYSTRINVNAVDAEVIIESKNGNKIGFYSNGCYYKTAKAVLKSDFTGYVTIIQKADGICPDSYTVTSESETIEVNPAANIHNKLLSMTQENDFKNAVITDPFGNTSPLVPKEHQSALAAAASGMAGLRNSAIGLIPGISNPILNFQYGVIMNITDKIISIMPASLTDNPFTQFIADVVSDVTAAFKWVIGKVKDLYDKTIGKAIDFVIQKTEKVWKLFIKIGEKVINVVIDCAAKVIEGIKNILEMIGIPVDKIIGFFKKALGLDRVAKINAAVKNMTELSIDILTEKASELKETSVEYLSKAVDSIQKWADIDMKNLSDVSLPDTTGKNNNLLNGTGITLDSHSMYFFDLVGSAVSNDIKMPNVKISDSLTNAIERLVEDIKEIGAEIGRVPSTITYIGDEVSELVKHLTLSDFIAVIKKILGVVAIDFLNISKAILKTIFDIVIEGIRAVWAALNTPIHIPFLSDILKILGINEFSMVDIAIFPAAFLAGTVSNAVKLVSGKELFDMDFIERAAKAKSLNELIPLGGEVYA